MPARASAVLCVDDDPFILEGYELQIGRMFDLDTATSAGDALALISERGPYQPFAVAVVDMRMPGMDGIELLQHIRTVSPDTVRIMLTGNADLKVAMDAVNQGHIFRFLTKPCPKDALVGAIHAGLEQHRLITAERELLSKTLSGSIKVLSEVLSLANPTAFGRSSRVRRVVRQIAQSMRIDQGWQCEVAAMLSQLGWVSIPEKTLSKVYRKAKLSPEEQLTVDMHPQAARELLANIPRLEPIADIVYYQEKRFDGQGFPRDEVCGEDIPLGSRVLKVALDYELLASEGVSESLALAQMCGRTGWYDPAVLEALRQALDVDVSHVVKFVNVNELPDRAVLADDVRTLCGRLLIAHGQEVTPSLRLLIETHAKIVGVHEPIKIIVPLETESPIAATRS